MLLNVAYFPYNSHDLSSTNFAFCLFPPVVSHHGDRMNGGHYTSDVSLPAAGGWLRFDDTEVVPIQEADVLDYSDGTMPYLLFYRRMDVA